MKQIALLGATGSVGTQTLNLIEKAPDKYKLVSLSAAGSNLKQLAQIINKFKPSSVSVSTALKAKQLQELLETKTQIHCESQGLLKVVSLPEVSHVVVALVGAIGIEPTLKALELGKKLIVANKETLVAAGDLIKPYLQKDPSCLIPADSEHVAIHQCLEGRVESVKQIFLTASGGPFYFKEDVDFSRVTAAQALKHPTWSMGQKISIDSATLMNKGLEVIEAERLFGLEYSQIKVLIHPQSLVHGMVELIDGSIINQMGPNDMRLPIQYALDYPIVSESLSKKTLNWKEISKLEFFEPDLKRFPCLGLAYEVGLKGKSYPAAFVVADDILVEAFLQNKITFNQIPELLEKTLEAHNAIEIENLQSLDEVSSVTKEFLSHVIS